MKAAVTASCRILTPSMLRKMSHRTWRRIRLCSENEGQHTDVMDALDIFVGMDLWFIL